ncbi:DUF3618 domain-containing protein [Nocardioides sp. NPDC101246]|uniref:DUF3618 domain-containing protein n=1 Tax=Nocardioides sp. NPDC101246 TaxID=3364336 RepID=UPI0038303A1C
MTQNHAPRPVAGGQDSIAAVEAELDTTRHEMADTLDELAARLDVKTRGKEKVHEVKERTQVAARSRDVQIRGGIVAALVVAMILMLARRKRRLSAG